MIDLRPIGKNNLYFRRTTDRYKSKGTFSSNKGYLSIARDTQTGRFVSRNSLKAKFTGLVK